MKKKHREEKDALGTKEVSQDAYYGIHTARSLDNFPISGLKQHSALVNAVVLVKRAAAAVNKIQKRLDSRRADCIIQACDEILNNKLKDQFVVDAFQMGAGTSLHMNCNEVIANRAEELMGGRRGDYALISPHDDVNMGQSTNDVFPTAMRLAVFTLIRDQLLPALTTFEKALFKKAGEFKKIIKSGRTHLQDAVPVTLGQEFKAYAEAVKGCRFFLEQTFSSLLKIGIGGTAVGTGLNTSPGYADLMVDQLREYTRLDLELVEDMREATQSMRTMSAVSAALRNLALELTRIANDLRLLSSGPRTGLYEISLPPVAPGSSMMPGKVNPSMLEMLNMVCYQVIGCDLTVASAVQAGQLELNVMMPVIAFNLCFMIEILSNSLKVVTTRCIEGIKAHTDTCRQYAEKSAGLITALSPYLGYSAAAWVVKQALKEGKTLVDVIEERGLLTSHQLKKLIKIEKMTSPNLPDTE
jgi:aspartate ammonia-lyase